MKKKYAIDFVPILIVLIIGLVALSIVFSLISNQTKSDSITADAFTGSNTSCVDITDRCILSLTSVDAGSVTVGANNYSTCFVNSGSTRYYDGIFLDDSEYNAASLNATYTEVDCNYVSGLTALTVNNIALIMAVVLLMFIAGFAMSKN